MYWKKQTDTDSNTAIKVFGDGNETIRPDELSKVVAPALKKEIVLSVWGWSD